MELRVRGRAGGKMGGGMGKWGYCVVEWRRASWVSWLISGVCGVQLCGCVRGCGGLRRGRGAVWLRVEER